MGARESLSALVPSENPIASPTPKSRVHKTVRHSLSWLMAHWEGNLKFEFTGPQTEFEEMFGGHYDINAYGPIGSGDCDRFFEFLEKTNPPPRSSVYISSSGGTVTDAIRMGLLIRGGWYSTHIGSRLLDHSEPSVFFKKRFNTNAFCMSAATLMYLGGRLRFMDEDAKFGVHQFSFQDPDTDDVSKSQVLSAEIAEYLSHLDIHKDFLTLSAATPNSEIDLIPKKKLEELGVVTGGITNVEWSTHARNGMMYIKGERDCIFGHHKMMLCFVKDAGFMVWAVIEAQGREEELLSNPLVEVTIDDEDTRLDISNRCERSKRPLKAL